MNLYIVVLINSSGEEVYSSYIEAYSIVYARKKAVLKWKQLQN